MIAKSKADDVKVDRKDGDVAKSRSTALLPTGKKTAKEKNLLITVRMSNLGLARSIAYTSWGDAGPAAATLNDNRGRGYKLQAFGHDVEVVGHASRATLAPGKFIEDVLVYPPPVADADLLRLELPGAALGLPGMFRFEIPRKMITFK